MHVFSVTGEAEFNPKKHVEKILGTIADGDVTVACWEPGQISPNHCHPHATEIYFCFEGGGTMRTPGQTIAVVPGAFVVHPPGEVHEYENGPQRTLLFRVRYGADMVSRHVTWRGHPGWTQSAEDADYYKKQPGPRLTGGGDRASSDFAAGCSACRNRRCRAWRLRIAQTNRRRIPAPSRSSGRNCDARAGPRPASRTTPQLTRRQP